MPTLRNELKILGTWFVCLILLRVSLLFPHRHIDAIGLINTALQLLLLIISIQLLRNGIGSQKYIFLNIAIFFSFIVPLFSNFFMGKSIFTNTKYVDFYHYVYVNTLGLSFIHLFTIFYIVVDYLFGNWKIGMKYLISLSLSSLLIILLFFPYLINPLSLVEENDYTNLQSLKQLQQSFIKQNNREPNTQELATLLAASQSNEQIQTGITDESALAIVKDLQEFLKEGGDNAVFWRPLHIGSIYVNLIILALIAIALFYIYFSEKPYSAYTDKILLLFFIFGFFEILHYVGYINSISSDTLEFVYETGQYFTILCLLLMVYTFDLKLRFVFSATGKYYEQIIQHTPERVTRWRDEFDTLILNSFFLIINS